MRQMYLEPIIQTEVSQKEKNNDHKLTHMYGIQKDGTDEPICRASMETQTFRTDLWTQLWGEGEGGMNWKIEIDIYTLWKE